MGRRGFKMLQKNNLTYKDGLMREVRGWTNGKQGKISLQCFRAIYNKTDSDINKGKTKMLVSSEI